MSLVRTCYVRDFNYAPVAPFTIQEVDISSARGSLQGADTLAEAVAEFVRLHIPIRWGWLCSIIDSTDRVVLQYYAKTTVDVVPWWGVAASFAELDRLDAMNPIDRAICESIAREAAT